VLLAEELHERGLTAINDGKVRAARPLLERARSRTQDQVLLARIEASLAYVLNELGDTDGARALCEQALRRQAVPADTRGIIEAQRALLLMRAGETGAALDAFVVAIDLLDGLPADQGKALTNRGGVYLQQGRDREAAADFAAAMDRFAAVADDLSRAKAEHNLGYALLLRGDLVGALRAMDAAQQVIAPVGAVLRAICEQDRAEALSAAGLESDARTALVTAAGAYAARRLHQRRGEAELALARSLVTVDPAAAGRAAGAAERRFRQVGSEAWTDRAKVIRLVAEVERDRRRRGLVADLDGVADRLRAQGLEGLAATAALCAARVLLRAGDLTGARARLDGRRRQHPLRVRLLDREVRADLAAADGRRAHALQHLRAGLSDLHAWQSSFGSLDLQTGVSGHGVRLAARGLSLAVRSGKPDVLFEWSERARMLASRVQPVRAPEDEQIGADLTELREMTTEGGQRDPDREAELRQRVRERAWQHRGSGEVADPVTLDELRSSLADDTALVAYVVAADRVVALVATTADVTRVDLGDRDRVDALLGGLLPDLDVAASELPRAMAGFVRQELADRLASIAGVLVDPVLGSVGDRSVVLTPSGVLAGVPWTLLPGLTGRPMTVAQSATSWLARRTTPLRSATAGFVAGPRVERAEDEVTAAAKEWHGSRLLTGGSANAAAVSELAASVDVLHVAAHGRHSSENAMFSGLQLADGPWFGYDIDQLRHVPDVVLLSACEVGRSTVRWGDELIGMTTAWLHAGARCVIASPAAVNDRAAYDVLVAVHQQLAAGVEPAAALAAAVPAVAADVAPVPLVCFG
jgi:tetratricopeptide (TPR) repeat protein